MKFVDTVVSLVIAGNRVTENNIQHDSLHDSIGVLE